MHHSVWKPILIAFTALAAVLPARGFQAQEPQAILHQVKPAMLVWSIGTNLPDGPTRMVETVTSVTIEGRSAWRITHYPHDAAATTSAEFDTYDVDADTLAPIRSTMRNPDFELTLSFTGNQVELRQVSGTTTAVERIRLDTAVSPEGPGLTVFIGSLPLREGYKRRYHIVDRWDGTEEERVKPMSLTVVEREWVKSAIGRQDAFRILIEPDDKSFRIIEYVRAQPPHYPLSVEYIRGTDKLSSEVTALVL
jgi:hypothetical protein